MTLLLTLLFVAAALALFSHFIAARITKAFPAFEWLDVDGERIHYRSMGEGPPIVLVHGLGGQMKNFDYLPLQQLAEHHRVVLVDRPGSGLSPRRDDRNAGIGAQGRLVSGFIRAMKFAQPPLLVGHSLGGAISLSTALQDPDCVAGVALIAPLTHFSPDVPAPFRAMAIRTPWLRRLFAQVLAAPLAILNSRKTVDLVFGPEPAPKDFPFRGGGLLSLRPGNFYGSSTDMCAVEDDLPRQEKRYEELRLPVFMLFGDADRVLDWKMQGEGLAAKVPQLKLELVPGAGHMLPVTRPAVTAEWLEGVARAVQRDLWKSEGP
jgi:pimeloyl-ACP methyl ester carboxylesterase